MVKFRPLDPQVRRLKLELTEADRRNRDRNQARAGGSQSVREGGRPARPMRETEKMD